MKTSQQWHSGVPTTDLQGHRPFCLWAATVCSRYHIHSRTRIYKGDQIPSYTYSCMHYLKPHLLVLLLTESSSAMILMHQAPVSEALTDFYISQPIPESQVAATHDISDVVRRSTAAVKGLTAGKPHTHKTTASQTATRLNHHLCDTNSALNVWCEDQNAGFCGIAVIPELFFLSQPVSLATLAERQWICFSI